MGRRERTGRIYIKGIKGGALYRQISAWLKISSATSVRRSGHETKRTGAECRAPSDVPTTTRGVEFGLVGRTER